ncbi:hypothetical protein pb186bvf_003234 [Paramecium bursaria]
MSKDSKKQKKQEVEPVSETSDFTKFLYLLAGVLIAYNINLYLKNQVSIEYHADGKSFIVDQYAKFIGDSGSQQIISGLKTNPKFDHISINVGLGQIKDIEPLFAQIATYTNLNNLTLIIGNNPLRNETAFALAKTLEQLPNLEYLNLGLDSIYNYEGREAISTAIGKLSKLHSLSLSFIHSDMSGEQLKALQQVTKARGLKSFDIYLVGSKLKSEEAPLLQSLIAQLPKLDRLYLNLYSNKLFTDGAITLSGGLFQQRQVKDLYLELYFNNITENGTESLMGAVEHMVDLQSLHLGLEFNYIKDEGGEIVGNTLQKLQKIKNLSINAATKNFGYKGYQSIIQSIEKMPVLDTLNIVIGVNRCGVAGAEDFKRMLFKHNTLKSLKFNFVENYVGDAGAAFLAEGIRQMRNLQELQVNVNFNMLTNKGALDIADAIKTAKSPKFIDLRLSQNQISDDAAKKIFDIVDGVLKKVDRFELEFLNTALTNTTRDVIVDRFEGLEKLELRINTIPPSNWEN